MTKKCNTNAAEEGGNARRIRTYEYAPIMERETATHDIILDQNPDSQITANYVQKNCAKVFAALESAFTLIALANVPVILSGNEWDLQRIYYSYSNLSVATKRFLQPGLHGCHPRQGGN